MRLSVVIPSLDGADLLRSYLPSVLRALGDLGEVVVVDDGSTDDTREALEELADPRLRWLSRKGPSGFCYAVNLGMAQAQGDLLLLLNNDVRPEPDSLRRLADAGLESSSGLLALVPVIVRPDGSDEGGCRVTMRRGLPLVVMDGEGVPYPSGACSLFTADAWREIGGLDTRFAPIYWEDVDLGLRAHRRGLAVGRLPEAVVHHRHAATMGSSPESQSLRERNRLLLASASPLPPGWRRRFRLWLPLHLVAAKLSGNRAFLEGWRRYRQMDGG